MDDRKLKCSFTSCWIFNPPLALLLKCCTVYFGKSWVTLLWRYLELKHQPQESHHQPSHILRSIGRLPCLLGYLLRPKRVKLKSFKAFLFFWKWSLWINVRVHLGLNTYRMNDLFNVSQSLGKQFSLYMISYEWKNCVWWSRRIWAWQS